MRTLTYAIHLTSALLEGTVYIQLKVWQNICQQNIQIRRKQSANYGTQAWNSFFSFNQTGRALPPQLTVCMRSQAYSYMDPSSSYVYGFSFGQLLPVSPELYTVLLLSFTIWVFVGLVWDWWGVDLWRMGDRSMAWIQIDREGSWKLQLAGVWRRCWWRPYGKDTDTLNWVVVTITLSIRYGGTLVFSLTSWGVGQPSSRMDRSCLKRPVLRLVYSIIITYSIGSRWRS